MHAYYLFRNSPMPAEMHHEIVAASKSLRRHREKAAYLEAAYDLVTKRYASRKIKTFSRIIDVFSTGVEDVWNRSGFLHCTNQNYILALLLVESGHFTREDIRPTWTLVWGVMPHQYLRVRLDTTWVNVDCWGRHYNIPYGDFAHAFNMSTFRKPIA